MKRILALVIVLLLVPLTLSAQDFCEGLADYDEDVDGTDASMFKSHFGRSPFGNPCPPDGPAPVPKTGQTDCYGEDGQLRLCWGCYVGGECFYTGEDGYWEKGIALPEPRFTINGNGTVTDNLTGLIWMRNANCFGVREWQEALDDCKGLSAGWCGLTDGSAEGDWRLPNRKELFSLIHDGYYHPAVSNTAGTGQWSQNDPFTDLQDGYYWSSTTFLASPYDAWPVNMFIGAMELTYGAKGIAHHVWCVRGGH